MCTEHLSLIQELTILISGVTLGWMAGLIATYFVIKHNQWLIK